MNAEMRGMWWGFAGVVVFGLTLPMTRVVVPWFDPVFIGLGRASLAAVVALVLLRVTRQPIPTRRQFLGLLAVAVGVVLGFPVLSAWAMQTVPAAHGGVVLGILPLLTALFGALVAHERPSPLFWFLAGLGSILVAVFVLLDAEGGAGNDDHVGDIALVLAVIAAAFSYAVGGRLSRSLGGWQVICWALVISLPVIIWPTLWLMPDAPTEIPLNAWLGFLYLALFSQLIGFFWWNKGLALGGIARVSQTQLLQTFVTLIAAGLMLGEAISGQTIIFACLIVAVVAFGRHAPIERRTP